MKPDILKAFPPAGGGLGGWGSPHIRKSRLRRSILRSNLPPAGGKVLHAFIAALCFFCLATSAHALTWVKGADAPTRTLEDYIKDYVDVPKGATSWKIFGATKQVNVEGKTKDGYDFQYFTPVFTPDVKALNGKQITVKGFMFPLGETEKQTEFLFGPFPVNCPFQYHVGPNLVFEVHADKNPVKFSYDAVTVTGTLQLVDKDPENSTFYRLVDAKVVKP